MTKVAVILPAAGKSSRYGGPEKKPFVSLDGRPIWQRAAELFWTRPDVSRVYLVVDPDDRADFRTRFAHLIAFVNVELVDGGTERFESVANALAKVPDDVPLVAVHDAVRPLTPVPLIDAVFAAAADHGAAMLAVPLADTLKQVDAANRVVGTVPRAGLWLAQTPQVFRRDWLTYAYARRAEIGVLITDDAQLVEATGRAVVAVPGSAANFKITTRDDHALAEAVLRSRTAKVAEARPMPRFGDDEAKW